MKQTKKISILLISVIILPSMLPKVKKLLQKKKQKHRQTLLQLFIPQMNSMLLQKNIPLMKNRKSFLKNIL